MKEISTKEQGQDDNDDEDSFGGVYLGPPGWLENTNKDKENARVEDSDNAEGKEADPDNNVSDQAPGIECMTKKCEEEGGNLEVTCNVNGGTNAMNGKMNVIVHVHVERE